MPQIFSKRANAVPHVTLVGSLFGGVFAVFAVWYLFSPEYTDVGYQPEQPISYSHRLHVGKLGLDCRYCHTNVEIAPAANIPATETCMNCHAQVRKDSPKLEALRESWDSGNPVQWINAHQLPDYVHFSHAIHVNNGVGCETCHGRIDEMEEVRVVEPLSMGWCLECHRQPELYLRPEDQVVKMGYVQPVDFIERNLGRIATESIEPPTNCSACHY